MILKIGTEMSDLKAGSWVCSSSISSNSVSEERYCKNGSWKRGFHGGDFGVLGLGFGEEIDDVHFRLILPWEKNGKL